MAKITIDGKQLEVEEGTNLFAACETARGRKLPHFCYHPGLPVVGVCRMCQVEIEGMPKLQIACNSRVKDGMVVQTRSERVSRAVQQILEFHLLHHPVDCPVCDQAGECSLQTFYMDHGLYGSDIEVDAKLRKAKVKPIGELVMLDAERCVLCARCTRFTSEITKTHELGIFNRGNRSEIDLAPGMRLDNNYSLNTVDLCPVGALTSRDFRFKKRVWWLETTDSICPGCSRGCNMTIDHHEGSVYRFRPRTNPQVNQWWMCDHGRLLYRSLAAGDRCVQPMVRDGDEAAAPAGWDHAWRRVEEGLERAGAARRLVVVGSPHSTLEELYALQTLLGTAAGGQVLGFRLAGAETAAADDLLLTADRTPNAEGARRLGLDEFALADLEGAAGAEAVLVILDNDLAGLSVDAAAALTRYGQRIYLATRNDATARLADVTLPLAAYAEKDGTFVNGDGRAQRLHAAVEAPREARPGWVLVSELAALLGHEAAWTTADDLLRELAATRPAFGALASGIPSEGLPLATGARHEVVGGEVDHV